MFPTILQAQTARWIPLWIHNPINYNDSTWTVVVNLYPPIAKYETPPIYNSWWNEISKCAGYKPNSELFKRLEFWGVNDQQLGFTIDVDTSQKLDGLSVLWENRIYLSFNKIGLKQLVQHEMLHFLLWYNDGYSSGHPPIFEKCKVDTKTIWAIQAIPQPPPN